MGTALIVSTESGSMTSRTDTIAVLYEHPTWLNPLFEELERRGAPFERLDLGEHRFDPGADPPERALVYNRMSPSAHLRGLPGAVEYTRAYLAHLERSGVRVINGSRAFDVEVSKARQVSLLAELGLNHPATRVIHRPEGAPAAAAELRFPVVVKPDVGGSGAGIQRFDEPDALATTAARGELDLGPSGSALVQEWVPRRDGGIVRVEVLDGEVLYAIRVEADEDRFDLCPVDLVTAEEKGGNGDRREPTAAESATCERREVRAVHPPDEVVNAVESIAAAAGIDVGGIEYMVDDRDGVVRFYDVNANSNFVADAERVVGFDPFVRLADYLLEAA